MPQPDAFDSSKVPGVQRRLHSLESLTEALQDRVKNLEEATDETVMAIEKGAGDTAMLSQSLNTLQKTVDLLQATTANQDKSLSAMEKAITALTEFIFGREDPLTFRHIPGLRDRVNADGKLVKILVLLGGVLVLRALGFPINWIGEAVLHYFGINVTNGAHTP